MRKFTMYMILLTLVLLAVPPAHGQDGGIKFSLGVAAVRMDDLKALQKHILSTYPVEGKITSSFPPFTSSSVIVFKQLFEQIRIGGGYSYSTTGGKSSYADYSGTLYTEMSATAHRLGAYLSYSVWSGEHPELSIYGKVEANLSDITIQSSYTILGLSNTIFNKYRSISPIGTVGTELSYKIKNFTLGVSAAYLVDLTGDLKNVDGADPLVNPGDRERVLTSDWTGWQVQLSARIPLRF
ncbi:MAG: hypothetical protein P1P86_09035 [Bacteroidales bacterium]|nr:hypothetical protein [Bacteroidales bacterium]